MTNPCYECPDREAGCHAKCALYQVWKSKVTQIREQIRDQRAKEQQLLDEPFRAMERSKK